MNKIPQRYHGLLAVHVAVFLFGLPGFLAKLTTLSPLMLVLGRTVFAVLALVPFQFYRDKKSQRPAFKTSLILFSLGILLAIHWLAFFRSIQISTVAIGLLTFSTFPLFVTFMEPIFFKERLRIKDVFLCFLIISGIFLIVPEWDFRNHVTEGVLWGVLSGFTYAILSLGNRRLVKQITPLQITFFQNGSAALILLPFTLQRFQIPPMKDFLILIFIGLFCTALAFALFVQSLKTIRTQLASLIACMEPVYGIGLALLFLGEIPSVNTVIGGILIMGSAIFGSTKREK